MAPFAWNIRDLHCYSVCLAAPENLHLVRVFSRFAVLQNENAANAFREKKYPRTFTATASTRSGG